MSTSTWVLIAIGVYCLVCLGLGFYAEKDEKSTTTSDYFLGGRKMGPFVSILAMTTTQLSSFALLGMPGYFYTHGISPWVMLFVNCMGMIGWYYLFAFRFYFMGKKYNYLTVGDFFEDRFGPKMHLVGSIAMILITLPNIAIQIMGFGNIVYGVTNGRISWTVGAIGLCIVMVLYIFSGGYKGVALTDAFQGIVMIVALLGGGLYIASTLFGGVPELFKQLNEMNPEWLTTPGPQGYWTPLLYFTWMLIPCGTVIQPQILTKFFTLKDVKTARANMFVPPILCFVIYLGALLIGLAAVLKIPGLSATEADSVSLMLVANYCGPVVASIIAIGIAAAAMSTADSQYITVSAIFVHDIGERELFKGKEIPQKKLVFWSRMSCLALMLFAFFIAALKLDSMVSLFATIIAPFSVPCLATILMGLYSRRVNDEGATAGLVAGFIVAVIFVFFVKLPYGINALFPATLADILATVIVTKLFPAPAQKTITKMIDQVNDMVYSTESEEAIFAKKYEVE